MKILLNLIFLTSILFPQYKIEAVKGDVKAQIGSSENFAEVKQGNNYSGNTLIVTGKNSFCKIKKDGSSISINGNSAIVLSNLRKMSKNEFLLALAKEDIRNTPKKNLNKSNNTAVYGSKYKANIPVYIESNDLGVKQLNGAVELGEQGYKEAAVIYSKEIFRKYPSTKNLIEFRMYFADILASQGLHEEAFGEYNSLKNIKMNESDKSKIYNKLEELKKIMNKK